MGIPASSIGIILAAGEGRRLETLTKKRPKCLLEIGGRTILLRQLQALKKTGVIDILIVIGYLGHTVREYVEKHVSAMNITFIHNPHYKETGTLYSLALAASALQNAGASKSIIQLNGDVVFDASIIERMLTMPQGNSLIATLRSRCGEEEIKVVVDKIGQIQMLRKDIDPAYAIGEAVGINKFAPAFWKQLTTRIIALQSLRKEEYFEYAIESTISSGGKILPYDINQQSAVEVDFPSDLECANQLFKA